MSRHPGSIAPNGMICSFVIPAHNEEDWISGSIRSVQSVADQLGLDYEVLVVADSCSDSTVELATSAGARVFEVSYRQIGATRNYGAREANGETLFFIDADTEVNLKAVELSLQALRAGAVGGGSTIRFDGKLPFFLRTTISLAGWLLALARYTGGCFFFCKRAAFEQVGGFDEKLYIAEEIFLARELKRLGRFVIVRGAVLTSARKARNHSLGQICGLFFRTMIGGKKACMKREGLDFWYGERRSDPGRSMGNEAPALPTSSTSRTVPLQPSTSGSSPQPSGAGAPKDGRRSD